MAFLAAANVLAEVRAAVSFDDDTGVGDDDDTGVGEDDNIGVGDDDENPGTPLYRRPSSTIGDRVRGTLGRIV